MSVIALKVSTNSPMPLSVSSSATVPMSIEKMRVKIIDRQPYVGSYEVTPGAAAVVLPTSGLRMTDNITVNPIPSNYGLITWNGSVLTVS